SPATGDVFLRTIARRNTMKKSPDLFSEQPHELINNEYMWVRFLVRVLKGTSKKKSKDTSTAPIEQFDLVGLFEKLGLPLWEDISPTACSNHSIGVNGEGWHGAWTEEEIYHLHEEVLKRTVHVLDDQRTSAKTKQSIMEWIAMDEDKPFSFKTCAIVSGCDPEELRERIFDLVSRLKRRRMAA
ncbi:MAG: hypothetical protein ACOYMG_20850, partial [Candidatus Methylumidiphilus sp.]